jgi:UDP-3-O-[3-hydroxymyristoyl] glucosamine N-acyltransferase
MNLTAEEITKLVKGRLQGDGARRIEGLAGLEEAGPTDITFIKDHKHLALLEKSRAGAVLVRPDLAPQSGHAFNGKTVILVENPHLAFVTLLQIAEKEKGKRPPEIHPSAVVHPSAILGKDVSIGPHAVIEENARIGDRTRVESQCYVGAGARIGADCLIYPQVVLREEVCLGDRCIIHPGAVIGSDGYGYLWHNNRHMKIPQIGTVMIEDDVEIGAGTTVDRATTGATRIGIGTKIDNLVQIAHNVQIGPHCLIIAQVGIAGSSRLGAGVVLAGQVGMIDHISVGDGAIVGAQSGISEDIPAHSIYFGSPAQPHMQYKRQLALIKKLGKKQS